MTQDRNAPRSEERKTPYEKVLGSSHYALLGLHPSASVREIRQAYRDLSKLYHPDTTALPAAIATAKFQQLNEAYATLSSPERRSAYDQKIGYSRIPVVQQLPSLNRPQPTMPLSSAYLDATDRPLSAGEIFALFILGLTFLACLLLAITIGFTKGGVALQPTVLHLSPTPTDQPPATVITAPPVDLPASAPSLQALPPHPAPSLEPASQNPSAPIPPDLSAPATPPV